MRLLLERRYWLRVLGDSLKFLIAILKWRPAVNIIPRHSVYSGFWGVCQGSLSGIPALGARDLAPVGVTVIAAYLHVYHDVPVGRGVPTREPQGLATVGPGGVQDVGQLVGQQALYLDEIHD
jgi:hypothetical protein